MKYKLIAVDLDDTLLNDSQEISKENHDALISAQEMGLKLVICTGRPLSAVRKYINYIEGYTHDDYVVVYNGSIITTAREDVLLKNTLEKEILKQLLKIGENRDLVIQMYDDKGIYAEKVNEDTKEYENISGTTIQQVQDLNEMETSIKFLFNSKNREELEKVKMVIEEKLGDRVCVFFSKPKYLEVLPGNSNKGKALKYLADYLGIKRDEVIAIGDGENDISMIKYAGLGIAMHNAKSELQKVADYVTKNSNNESGVAEAIEKFVLRE